MYIFCIFLFLINIQNITWVESRDAKVISRFPFRPKSAGTRINISLIVSKTSQCWTMSKTMPAPTIPSPAIIKGKKICTEIEIQDSFGPNFGSSRPLKVTLPLLLLISLTVSSSSESPNSSIIENSTSFHEFSRIFLS